MAYYPEDQSTKNLGKIRQDNVCAICGRPVWIFLDLKDKRQYIACSTPGHDGLSREYEPPREDYQSDIRRSIEMERKVGLKATDALATIPKHGQLTQSQAMHILKLVYPDVPEEEIIRCAILCRDFGLHPLMKEVYLIPFKNNDTGEKEWVTVLGINATRKLMALRGTYSYFDDTPRLMTIEEQKRIFGEVDALNIVAITKLRTKDGLEAPGYGRWPKDKQPRGTDKGNTKANMAFIRSERNAFGRLSPDALPQGVDVIDEAYVEVPDIGKVETAIEIDTTTGEIIESTATVIDEPEPELIPEAEVHHCDEHNRNFTMKVKYGKEYWSHSLPGGKWCNEKDQKAKPKTQASIEPPLPGDFLHAPEPEPTESTATTKAPPLKNVDELYARASKFGLSPRDVCEANGVGKGEDISNFDAAWVVTAKKFASSIKAIKEAGIQSELGSEPS